MGESTGKKSLTIIGLVLIIFIFLQGTGSAVNVYAQEEILETTGSADIIWEGNYAEYTELNLKASENWQKAKKALAKGIDNLETQIDISEYGIDLSDAAKIYAETINEHPEFFYVGGSYGIQYSGSKLVAFIPWYAGSASEIAKMKAEFKEEVDNCVKYVKTRTTSGKKLSDAEIALQVNDYIATHTIYIDTDSKSEHTAYSILVKGYGVCDGYAGAFLYLCDYIFGIDTRMVISSSMGHAWNMIKVDGSWYHVDVCWNDPNWSDRKVYYVEHDYFLCSDKKFKEELSHTSWNDNGITCTSTKYDAKFGKKDGNSGINVLWGDYWYYYRYGSFYRYKSGEYEPERVCRISSYPKDAIYAGDAIYYLDGNKIFKCNTDGTNAVLFSNVTSYANCIGFEGEFLAYGVTSGHKYGFNKETVTLNITGEWKKYGSKWYFKQENKWLSGWLKKGSEWFYLNASDEGAMQTGWKKISGKWYYFNGRGVMQTGWEKISGKWYYFNDSGAMQTGWKKISDKWYYFNANGAMQTGWVEISGKSYYFYSSGKMASSEWIGRYYVNSDGVWSKTR